MDVNVAVIDVELSTGIQDFYELQGSARAHVLVRLHGKPLSRFELPVSSGVVQGCEIWLKACEGFPSSGSGGRVLSALAQEYLWESAPYPEQGLPSCSIVIGTRNRPEDLRRCLSALAPAVGDGVEVIVVDNDPADDETMRTAADYPVRYFRQERRGLNRARARGAILARNEILLFVDDDVVVDRNWVNEIRKPFLDEHVAAVTGAVEPLEFTTHGQYLQEVFSSFYRGFDPQVHNLATSSPAAAGRVGAGANMAVRRSMALEFRIFEAELDGGTAAKSGGDVYALYKVLRAGYNIAYAPAALVWHRHRKSYEELERMLYGYSVGGYCVLLRALMRDKDLDALLIGVRWFFEYHLAELLKTLRRQPGRRPLRLILTEIKGALYAPVAYWCCGRQERATAVLLEDRIGQPS